MSTAAAMLCKAKDNGKTFFFPRISSIKAYFLVNSHRFNRSSFCINCNLFE